MEKYGKLVGFYLGTQPVVVVADYEMMKDLLKRDEVSGRPPGVPFNEFRPGHSTVGKDNIGRNPGVLHSQGRDWREQRRFLLRNLRDFGFGKTEILILINSSIAFGAPSSPHLSSNSCK